MKPESFAKRAGCAPPGDGARVKGRGVHAASTHHRLSAQALSDVARPRTLKWRERRAPSTMDSGAINPRATESCRAIRFLIMMVVLSAPLLVRAQGLVLGDSSIGIIDGVSSGGGFSASGFVGVLGPEASTGGGYSAEGRVTLVVPETPSSPHLNITRTVNQIVISWPVAAGDFALDETSSLAGTISWTPVPPPYVTNATQINITVPVSSGPRYYRLRKSIP